MAPTGRTTVLRIPPSPPLSLPLVLLCALSISLSLLPHLVSAGVFGDVGVQMPQVIRYAGQSSLTNFNFIAPPPPRSPPPPKAAAKAKAAAGRYLSLRQLRERASASFVSKKTLSGGATMRGAVPDETANYTVNMGVLAGRFAVGTTISSSVGIDAWTAKYSGTAPKYNNTNDFHSDPSPGGCVGNGFVIQLVNRAIQVYSTVGLSTLTTKKLTAIIPFNQFLGLPPFLAAGSSTPADSVLQGSCVFDQKQHRFYMSFQWLTSGAIPSPYDQFGQTRTGSVNFGSGLIVAKSNTPDPRLPWKVYFIPTTNDGTNSNDDTAAPVGGVNAPFYQDFPQLNIDAFGVTVTTTEYSNEGDFVGYNIYAMSKLSFLAASDFTAARVVVPAAQVSASWNNLSPVHYPGDANIPFDQNRNGTTYFVSTTSNNTVIVLALCGTGTLNSSTPLLFGYVSEVPVPAYKLVQPGGVMQRGPYKTQTLPLGAALNKTTPLLTTSGDGTLPTTVSAAIQYGYGGGRDKNHFGSIWITFNVGVSTWTSLALVQVTPTFVVGSDGKYKFATRLSTYRVLNMKGENLLYPAISFSRNGRGVVACTVAGATFWPTALFLKISERAVVAKSFILAGPGGNPLDNNDAYNSPSGVSSFGGTQSVYMDSDGQAWCFLEYVNGGHQWQNESATPYDALGGWANWSTQVIQVSLQDTLTRSPP